MANKTEKSSIPKIIISRIGMDKANSTADCPFGRRVREGLVGGDELIIGYLPAGYWLIRVARLFAIFKKIRVRSDALFP